VVVVGGGSSATDVAALLHAGGAFPTIVSRNPVRFSEGPKPGKRSLYQRLRKPHLGLGASFRSTLYTLFPNLFHLLPRSVRLRIVKRHLGPIGGWFMKPLVEGVIPIRAGYSLREASETGGEVKLVFADREGKPLELTTDYVIAATGYEMAVDRLPILDRSLLGAIEVEEGSPVLSGHFESSVPGLYFMGLLAANSFGPLLRFALGAEFCAVNVATHLARVTRKRVAAVDIQPERAPG
jgi:hypothetical protein